MNLNEANLLAVAHAFGLGHEFSKKNLKVPDPFGPVVKCIAGSNGFCTRIKYDRIRQFSSSVTVTDTKARIDYANEQLAFMTETEYAREMQKPQEVRDPIRYRKNFTVDEATFAGVESPGHVPERVFLFTSHFSFDLDYVIERLRYHRSFFPVTFKGICRTITK